ncbi:MAG: hypothetical protein J6O49_20760, partial [Bacteroidaceae bacterium]|nr:hypothetical protein [Bacteroidaceae bacterium]
MPNVKTKFIKGGTSGINNTSLRDGQILFDQDLSKIYIDTYKDNVLTRVLMTKNSSGGGDAEDITYNNTISELEAKDVQSAIDEVVTILDEKVDAANLGTAAEKNVAASGDAGSTEVVMGNDTRLSDARPASDVSSWAKAASKPTYTASEVGAYTKSEVDNLLSTIETNIDWKEAVDTYSDIATTYPNPQDGWTVNVKDTDYTYRFNGSNWVAISANAIPEATTSVNGLMTTDQVTKLNGIAIGAEVNVQSDWNVTDSSSDAFIKNKPNIPQGTVKSVATGTGLTGGPITKSGTISLKSGVVTAGSAGPTAAVTGNNGSTIAVPRITVDT